MSTHHLAQYNIARGRSSLDRPQMSGFVERLAPVNALAEQSEGFVWRLQGEGGDATSIRPYDEEDMLVNLTVWESVEAFQAFSYGGAHLEMLKQRSEWFEPMEEETLVLWWIPAGELPTVEEAKRRLEKLQQEGPSLEAFTIRQRFAPPTA